MSISTQIAKHFREIYFGRNWTVSNLQEHLKDITWQQATTKVYDFNTIAVLVNHIHYYVLAATKVLQGEALNAKDEESFAHALIASQKDWDDMLNKMWNDAAIFSSLIEALPEHKLLENFTDEKYGIYYRNIHGIIEHAHYHLGQIVLLKKIIQKKRINMIVETERLILREVLPSDDEGMFELDSNPEVHKYLGNNTTQTIEQARQTIATIRQQYIDNGIGRWAAIEKETGNFIGWSGLKFIREYENNHINFYDVGYRFMPKYWGKGYATESAKAALEYGFTKLQLTEIIGSANIENSRSRRALEKCGLTFVEKFMWKDLQCDWLKITKAEWEQQQKR